MMVIEWTNFCGKKILMQIEINKITICGKEFIRAEEEFSNFDFVERIISSDHGVYSTGEEEGKDTTLLYWAIQQVAYEEENL